MTRRGGEEGSWPEATMEKPKLQLVTPRGPDAEIWDRLLGQFWIRHVLSTTDLPEGPHLEPGTFRPRN